MKATYHEPTGLVLRPVCTADSGLLFVWNNALRTSGAALSGFDPIERTAHDSWFAARLEAQDCRIRIIEHAGTPAGVVRLDRETESAPDAAVVSVFVAPEARRQGLASAAVERALCDTAREGGALTAIARVRLENAASRRLFGALGFAPIEWYADHVVLQRRVST